LTSYFFASQKSLIDISSRCYIVWIYTLGAFLLIQAVDSGCRFKQLLAV